MYKVRSDEKNAMVLYFASTLLHKESWMEISLSIEMVSIFKPLTVNHTFPHFFSAVSTRWIVSDRVHHVERRQLDPRKRDQLLNEILLYPTTARNGPASVKRAENKRLEDFLWTGSQDNDVDYDDLNRVDQQQHQHQQQQDQSTSSPWHSYYTTPISSIERLPEKLPDEQYLVRTVLESNMTVIHNGIESFKAEMENKLTDAYRHAYQVKRYRRNLDETTTTTIEVNVDGDDLETTTATPTTTDIILTLDDDEVTTMWPNMLQDDQDREDIFETTTAAATTTTLGETTVASIEITTTTIATTTTNNPIPTASSDATPAFVNIPYFDLISTTSTTTTDKPPLTATTAITTANSGLNEVRQPRRDEDPEVKIHNIRSSLPKPEIEMIYTVSKGKEVSFNSFASCFFLSLFLGSFTPFSYPLAIFSLFLTVNNAMIKSKKNRKNENYLFPKMKKKKQAGQSVIICGAKVRVT